MPIITKRQKLHPKFLEMYNSGASDQEIAKELGYKTRTIQQWRYYEKLPSNLPPHRPCLARPHHESIVQLRGMGATYQEIGEVLGISSTTVRKYYISLPSEVTPHRC